MLTLTIPAPCKPLNSNNRLHHHAKRRLVAAWRARAHVAAIQAGRPKLTHAHVTATVHTTTARKFDAANFYPTIKAILDGIVSDAGCLPDDDNDHVVGPDLRPGPKAPVFTVTITLNDSCGCGDCLVRFGGVA